MFLKNKERVSRNKIKYTFQKSDKDKSELSYAEFINGLREEENKCFVEELIRVLNDATSEFSAYFWECVPVSKVTLNKEFEFVVTKSEALNNISQNFSSFDEHLFKKTSSD